MATAGPKAVRIDALSEKRDQLDAELKRIKARLGELLADILYRIIVKEESAASAAAGQAWGAIHALSTRRDMLQRQMKDILDEWESIDDGDDSGDQ